MTTFAFRGRTCGECAFHDAATDEPKANGFCRRYPPRPMLVPQTQQRLTREGLVAEHGASVNSFFPVTMNSIAACGEFQPADGMAVQ